MDLSIDRHLSFRQLCCLPVFTPYSIRHLKKKGWGHKTLGVIELVPIISLLATLLEKMGERNLHAWAQIMAEGSKEPVILITDRSIFMEHFPGEFHPESPHRMEAIEDALENAGLLREENRVPPRQATRDEVLLCHDEAYLEDLERQIESLQERYLEHASFDGSHCKAPYVEGDFQYSAKTLDAALYAAGAPLTAIDTILNPQSDTTAAFCIVRPPGHHAHRQTGSGFCVFNNAAIAAKHLTKNLGFKRVLIADWDAHHGDGTQDLTQDDPSIFYFSTHWDTGTGFYPGPHWGRADQTGMDKGKGTVLNCPISGTPEACRKAILDAFRKKLPSAMESYKPEFVLISCGFDGHENDTLVGMGLKSEDYAELTDICTAIADQHAGGRIVSVLEGGYDLDSIAAASVCHVKALMRTKRPPV